MKLWFIEPRPNIFVSGIRDSLAKKVIDYLYQHCPSKSGLMIFKSLNTCPGYEIYGMGDNRKPITEISGLQLVMEKSADIPLDNLLNPPKPL